MAWTLKNSKTGTDTTFVSSVTSAAFTSALTNPSIILVAWQGDAGFADSANTPTDTAGNSYVKVISTAIDETFDLEIWYALNKKTTAANQVTITDNIGGSDGIIIVQEWTGSVLGSPVDQTVGNFDLSGTSSALDSSNMASTYQANDLIWGAGVVAVGSSQLSAGSGFSNLVQDSTAFSNLAAESKQVTVSGAYNAALTSAGAGSWCCAVVAIRGTLVSPLPVHFRI